MENDAKTVLRVDKPAEDYLRDTSALNSRSWWRFGNQIRSIVIQKELSGTSASPWFNAKTEKALKQCKDASMVDKGQSYQAVLDRELPIEMKLRTTTASVAPEDSIEQWVGTKVDLVRDLGVNNDVVCYVQSRFTLDESTVRTSQQE